MPNRKVIFKFSWYAGVVFWFVGVIANHGLGKIKVQTPAVVVGEVGFLCCGLIGVMVSVVTVFRHRPAYRRLQARWKRQRLARKPQPPMRGFEVVPKPRGDSESE